MLTPDEIASRQFLIALRGYDRDEVQAFLTQVAEERRTLEDRLVEVESQLELAREAAAGSASALPAAAPVAEPTPAAEPAPAPITEPRAVFAALGEETTRILVAAEESARSIRERAEERARTELESSRREARDEVATARRTSAKIISDAEARRNGVAEEIRRLEATRDRYAEDLRGAVVTVQNAMRSLSTSGQGGGRPAGTPSPDAGTPDASDDDPARAGAGAAGSSDTLTDHAGDGSGAAATSSAFTASSSTSSPSSSSPSSSAPSSSSPSSSSPSSSSDDTDAVLDQIEADIRAAEERDALTAPAANREPVDEDDADAFGAHDAVVDEQHAGDVADDAPSADGASAAPAPAEAPVVSTPADGAGTAAAVELDDARRAQQDARALQLRDESATAIRPGLLRILKRSLQDVQNGVLDDLRQAGDAPVVAELLPDEAALERLAEVARPHLATAHEAGAADGATLADVDGSEEVANAGLLESIDGLAAALAAEITTNLRATLTAGLAAEEPSASLSERIGEVFRDLKGPIVEGVVDEQLHRAYHWGAIARWSSAGVTGKRWVAGDEVRCPGDLCAGNASMGTLPLDASFASGESVPPPHDGCDCTLAPVS